MEVPDDVQLTPDEQRVVRYLANRERETKLESERAVKSAADKAALLRQAIAAIVAIAAAAVYIANIRNEVTNSVQLIAINNGRITTLEHKVQALEIRSGIKTNQ